MVEHRLLDLIAPWVEQGQARFADELRRLVHVDAPEIFALLDFEADAAFLEPMAFAYAARGTTDPAALAVIYAGAIAPERRPQELVADTDDHGRLFLPSLGYLTGFDAKSHMELVPHSASTVGYLAKGSVGTARPLTDWMLGDSGLSLLAYPIEALASVVTIEGDSLGGIAVAARSDRGTLTNALAMIRTSWPALAVAMRSVTRHVVLFDNRRRNSFATTAAHGIAFLNAALGRSESFFVEDLAHQCGHVLFTAAWNGADPLLLSPVETSLGEVTGKQDHRSLEVALHGMVTQTLMVSALDALLESAADVDRHEATGRLLFALLRLGLDLRTLAPLSLYTESGMRLMRELISAYTEAAEKHGERLLAVDFSGQPYNFDYAIFCARNPITRSLARL